MRSFKISLRYFPRARAIEILARAIKILARATARAPCTRLRAVRTRIRGTQQNPRYINIELRHHGGRWCRFRHPEAKIASLSSRCESNHSNGMVRSYRFQCLCATIILWLQNPRRGSIFRVAAVENLRKFSRTPIWQSRGR